MAHTEPQRPGSGHTRTYVTPDGWRADIAYRADGSIVAINGDAVESDAAPWDSTECCGVRMDAPCADWCINASDAS